ncbi:hypothetical protein J6590_007610 [Homalodisca vitripennis]|nr:hypothetical protein J6590_007610 [Homalodisca vitripennis]
MRARIGTVPLPGSGIGTGFPFAQWVPSEQRLNVVQSRVSRLPIDKGFLLGLSCSQETLLHGSPQGPRLSICYYHQDLRRRRLQAGSRLDPSVHTAATLLLVKAGPPTLPLTAEYRHDATAPSIFRASCFGSSDDRFARQNRYGPPSGFPLTSFVLARHSSPSFGSQCVRSGCASPRNENETPRECGTPPLGPRVHPPSTRPRTRPPTVWRTEEPGTSTVILVRSSLRPARTPDKRWRSDTCVPYRRTIGRATRGPGARYGRSFPASRATAGAVDRRPTGRDVLLREKCGPLRPA